LRDEQADKTAGNFLIRKSSLVCDRCQRTQQRGFHTAPLSKGISSTSSTQVAFLIPVRSLLGIQRNLIHDIRYLFLLRQGIRLDIMWQDCLNMNSNYKKVRCVHYVAHGSCTDYIAVRITLSASECLPYCCFETIFKQNKVTYKDQIGPLT
jgi:hypothetical protein